MSTIPPPEAGLESTSDELVEQVAAFLDTHRPGADALEVWVRRARRIGHRLGQTEGLDETTTHLAVRVWRDSQLGEATASQADDPEGWDVVLRRALASLAPTEVAPPGPPSSRRPEPSVYDPSLPEALADQHLLPRLAQALEENTRHEAERIPGLQHLTGHVIYEAGQRVVGNFGGVVAEQTGYLDCEVDLEGAYGEQVRLVHLADSFLPFALMGARSWRTMPREVEVGQPGARMQAIAIVHPRVLEALVRAGLTPHLAEPEADAPARYSEGELIMSPTITLVDDPGLDGLAGSRAFDDEGQPTRRTALIIRGRMTQHLRGRQAAARTGRPATGSTVRWPTDPARGLHLGLSCVLMERGQPQFHDLVNEAHELVVVHALRDDLVVDPETTAFSATVRWATALGEGTRPRVLAPGRWRIEGHLLGPQGILHEITPCRDVLDTGTGILPYARCVLTFACLDGGTEAAPLLP